MIGPSEEEPKEGAYEEDQVEGPQELRTLSESTLAAVCDDCRAADRASDFFLCADVRHLAGI